MSETTEGTTGKSPEELELETLAREIAAEREALDAAEARIAPTEGVAAKKAELAKMKRLRADAEVVAQLVEKHGELGVAIASIETPEGVVVVKRPPFLAYKRFTDRSDAQKGASVEEQELLARTCLVHPPLQEWTRLFNTYPGVIGMACNAVLTLSGIKADARGKG